MILCQKLKIIFIKTKKVGGTSFEIALSKFCNSNDIITPISIEDEKIRKTLGYQKPVNYEENDRSLDLLNIGIIGNFNNHMSSQEIFNNVGKKTFNEYTKISIHRDPFDFLISQYFYKMRKKTISTTLSFKDWIRDNYKNFLLNFQIAPLNGPLSPNIILKYETLYADIQKINLLPKSFIEDFKSLKAKAGIRPVSIKDPISFFNEEDCGVYIPKIDELIKYS